MRMRKGQSVSKRLLLVSIFALSFLFASDTSTAISVFQQGYYVAYSATVNVVSTTITQVTPSYTEGSRVIPIYADAIEIATVSSDVYFSQVSSLTDNVSIPVNYYTLTNIGKKYTNTQYGIQSVYLKKLTGSVTVLVRWLLKKQTF